MWSCAIYNGAMLPFFIGAISSEHIMQLQVLVRYSILDYIKMMPNY